MKRLFLLMFLLLSGCTVNQNTYENIEESTSQTATIQSRNNLEENVMRLLLTINEQNYTISLNNSQAAIDFYQMMPLDLTLSDFNQTEKVADLPKSLRIDGSPSGAAAQSGQLAYYAPWENLAIFYQDFRYGEGLVILGEIDQGADMLRNLNQNVEITFSQLNE
ncbi:cyclophilin-like fold protein [Enterococcus sp. AZ103]|uniref:cyclophilin-like fold protein n=1 Tax=Enterococcus sp. AZ103 TaxID=2774628 RepID=UPI003F25A32D